MRKIVILLATALCIVGCNKSEMKDVLVLGGKPKVVILPDANAGKGFFDVITNVKYETEVVKGADWLSITGSDDVVVTFDYYANNGFARESRIVLSCRERSDTISIRQAGLYEPFVELSQTSINIPCEGASGVVDVRSNIPCSCLEVISASPQIRSVVLEDNLLKYEVLPTTKKDTKKYPIVVRFVNDWGEATEDTLTLVQEPLK